MPPERTSRTDTSRFQTRRSRIPNSSERPRRATGRGFTLPGASRTPGSPAARTSAYAPGRSVIAGEPGDERRARDPPAVAELAPRELAGGGQLGGLIGLDLQQLRGLLEREHLRRG